MRPTRTVLAALVAASVSTLSVAGTPGGYSVTDLGVLPGGSFSRAHAISDSGFIAGESTANGEGFYTNSFLWIDGRMIDLGGLGVSGSVAMDVNDAGVAVGVSDVFEINAFRWEAGVLTPLLTLGGFSSGALSIDSAGRIVGSAGLASGEPRAVMWIGSEIVQLGTLGGFGSTATAISSTGFVAGNAAVASGLTHAFLWDGTTMHDLGSPAGGHSSAHAINAHNDVVGYSHGPGVLDPTLAVLWRKETFIDLGSLGGSHSYASGVNDDGVVVGSSYLRDAAHPTQHAFIWERGVMRDLNDLIAPGADWMLAEAADIDSSGRIVGSGIHAGHLRAFLLTPNFSSPADLNHDGLVDGLDLASLLAAWGTCPGKGACAADLNRDGSVNGIDLAMLLAAWAP